jgi:cysteine desulfurase
MNTQMYFDYNASTPLDTKVAEFMTGLLTTQYGNAGSRTHEHGTVAREVAEKGRRHIATLLAVEPSEIIFTSGATESNNIAILGMASYGIDTGKKHIITTAIEHKAVLEPLNHLAMQGFDVDFVTTDESGIVSVKDITSKVRKDTLMVSVMSANNETGVIQPFIEIGEALAGSDVYFHIDAAQSCGKMVDELREAKYDMMSITSHKMYGPQGVGALILRNRKYKKPPVKPITFGGGHEGGYRPGTLPVLLIAGFGKAAEIAISRHKENWERYREIKADILRILSASGVQYKINGTQENCMPNTLNVSFLGVDSEALMLAAKQYCSLSNGSACTSSGYTYSHVLTAMGLSEERIESAIRFSWGTEFEGFQFVKALEIVKSLQ